MPLPPVTAKVKPRLASVEVAKPSVARSIGGGEGNGLSITVEMSAPRPADAPRGNFSRMRRLFLIACLHYAYRSIVALR
jgi:hypothetical protein